MRVKQFLRKYGYDVRRYYSFWDTAVLPMHIKTVLDIGANNGEFSKEIFAHLPDAEVYAFEPLPDCFATLKNAFINNPHMHAMQVALGDSAGEMEMQRSSFHPSSSLRTMAKLHKDLYPKTAGMQKETITVARLDEVMRDAHIHGNMMIKIDVQGFEDAVIRGGTETFKRASLVLIETSFVELYEGQPLFGDIHDQLKALGFLYRGAASEHRNPKNGELLYQDSIFVR